MKSNEDLVLLFVIKKFVSFPLQKTSASHKLTLRHLPSYAKMIPAITKAKANEARNDNFLPPPAGLTKTIKMKIIARIN